jgi:hypothetical protein
LQAILKPLFGIEAEIKAALKPDLEHSVAHVRMSWWAEEAQRLRAGRALHPLTRALLAQRPPSAAAADISGLVDVATWDLASATFETGSQLAGYCDRWARATTQLAAGWAAAEQPLAAEQFGHALGVALCELDMLIRLQESARAGRVRMPLDELTALNVAPEALAQPPWPEALSGTGSCEPPSTPAAPCCSRPRSARRCAACWCGRRCCCSTRAVPNRRCPAPGNAAAGMASAMRCARGGRPAGRVYEPSVRFRSTPCGHQHR